MRNLPVKAAVETWKRKRFKDVQRQFEDKILSGLQDSRCNVSHEVHELIKPVSIEDLKHTVKRMKKSGLDMKASIALVLK